MKFFVFSALIFVSFSAFAHHTDEKPSEVIYWEQKGVANSTVIETTFISYGFRMSTASSLDHQFENLALQIRQFAGRFDLSTQSHLRDLIAIYYVLICIESDSLKFSRPDLIHTTEIRLMGVLVTPGQSIQERQRKLDLIHYLKDQMRTQKIPLGYENY